VRRGKVHYQETVSCSAKWLVMIKERLLTQNRYRTVVTASTFCQGGQQDACHTGEVQKNCRFHLIDVCGHHQSATSIV
jgi:hypothetical protein